MNWLLRQGCCSAEPSAALCHPLSSVGAGLRPCLPLRAAGVPLARVPGPRAVVRVATARGGCAGAAVARVTARVARAAAGQEAGPRQYL